MPRGILATVTALPTRPGTTEAEVRDVLEQAYAGEPFVQVLPPGRVPHTAATFGSNSVQLSPAVDVSSGRVIVVSAIDNLGKGGRPGRAERQPDARPGRVVRLVGQRDRAVKLSLAAEKAATLIDALPWLARFHGKIVVIKFGGNAMVSPELSRAFAEDVVFLRYAGLRPVIVHGGGPQITEHLERLGIASEFRGGLRVTTPEAMQVVGWSWSVRSTATW